MRGQRSTIDGTRGQRAASEIQNRDPPQGRTFVGHRGGRSFVRRQAYDRVWRAVCSRHGDTRDRLHLFGRDHCGIGEKLVANGCNFGGEKICYAGYSKSPPLGRSARTKTLAATLLRFFPALERSEERR